jgi:hypothetical protein
MIKNEGRCITNVPNLDCGSVELNERFYRLWYDRLMKNELPVEEQCNWYGWVDPRFVDLDNDKVYSMVDLVATLPDRSESKRKGRSKQIKADKEPVRGKKPKKI